VTTSGDGIGAPVAYLVVLAAVLLGTRPARIVHPVVVAVCAVVAVPSVLGLLSDRFYAALARDPDAIRRGQVWRLLTALVVQDGGVAGTIFLLVALWVFASRSVRLRGPGATVALLLVGGLAFQLLAAYVLDVPGAGSSGPVFFLATTLLGSWRPFAVVLAVSVALIVARDAHGSAFLAGLVVPVRRTWSGGSLPVRAEDGPHANQ
jgi:hypothetical protein